MKVLWTSHRAEPLEAFLLLLFTGSIDSPLAPSFWSSPAQFLSLAPLPKSPPPLCFWNKEVFWNTYGPKCILPVPPLPPMDISSDLGSPPRERPAATPILWMQKSGLKKLSDLPKLMGKLKPMVYYSHHTVLLPVVHKLSNA